MHAETTGGCLCGGVRYELKTEPVSLTDCHCVDCRRSSGAPYVTWGTVPRESLLVTKGELRRVPHAGRIRSFATCCGTPLFFEEDAAFPTIDVTIASLDDPVPFGPKKVIWIEDRLPWVRLEETLPHYRRRSGEELA